MKKIIIVSFIILCAVSTVIYQFSGSENSKKQITVKVQKTHDDLGLIVKDNANLDAKTIDQKTKIPKISVVKVDELEDQEKLQKNFSDWADTFDISHSGKFHELKFSFTELSYFPSNGTKGLFSFVYDDNDIVHMGRYVEDGKENEISSYSESFHTNKILKNCDNFFQHEDYLTQIGDIDVSTCDDKNFYTTPGEATPFYGFSSLKNPKIIHLYAITGGYKKEFIQLDQTQKPLYMKDLLDFKNGKVYEKENLQNILNQEEYAEFQVIIQHMGSELKKGEITIEQLQSTHMDDVWFERSEKIQKLYDYYSEQAG